MFSSRKTGPYAVSLMQPDRLKQKVNVRPLIMLTFISSWAYPAAGVTAALIDLKFISKTTALIRLAHSMGN